MKNIKIKSVLKYLAVLFAFVVFANASINGLNPFVYAFFFACLFVGLDEKLCSAFLLFSSLLLEMTLNNLFTTLAVVGVGLIMFYLHKFLKQPIKIYTLFVCFVLSLIVFIYYNFFETEFLLMYLALALICLYAFVSVLHVVFKRKNCFKLTIDEAISFLFTIAICGAGFAPVEIFCVEFYRFVLMLVVLIFIASGNSTLTYAVVASFAFGVSLQTVSLLPLAEFVVIALLCSVFNFPHKFNMCLMAIIAECFLNLYFYWGDWQIFYQLMPIIFACIVFLCLPNKLLNNLADIVYQKKSEISSRSIINTTRKTLKKRMADLSNIFLDMKQIHLNMVKKELTKEELVSMLTREVMNNCCKDCLDKPRCTRALGTDNKSSLEMLVETAVVKGKVTLLDLPPNLTSRCAKINQLTSLINRVTDEYKQYKGMMNDVNNVKILLADQMGAVSNLMLSIGEEIDANVTYDVARENKIISKLLSMNIECKEVLLYNEKNDDISAVLIVKCDNSYFPAIEKVVSSCLKTSMQVTSVTPSVENDFLSITLRRKSRFDCIFGLAGCNKSGNNESGDCHSILRLGRDRFLLALCDGMGSGKNANRMSVMTLGLIENFYKVGFDNDVVVESVNKLMAVNNQESYSTLDVCLLDLNRECADFIKVGSPFGLIKREGTVDLVEGGSLPIGALDNITPMMKRLPVTTKDLVIMATDGITDAFNGEENMIEFVSHLASNNPQTLAEAILNEALRLNEMSAKDDMTVLVARTYLKN